MRQQAEAVLPEDEVQQLLDLAPLVTNAASYKKYYRKDIIFENGLAYLAGDKSLDETVELIQSKVIIYLSEQYG